MRARHQLSTAQPRAPLWCFLDLRIHAIFPRVGVASDFATTAPMELSDSLPRSYMSKGAVSAGRYTTVARMLCILYLPHVDFISCVRRLTHPTSWSYFDYINSSGLAATAAVSKYPFLPQWWSLHGLVLCGCIHLFQSK